MTAQEIKNNMTAGEWGSTVRRLNNRGTLNDYLIIHSEQLKFPIARISLAGNYGSYDLPNAAAITTAVNATYCAGIDPACVGEMIKMLEQMSHMNPLIRSLVERAKLK